MSNHGSVPADTSDEFDALIDLITSDGLDDDPKGTGHLGTQNSGLLSEIRASSRAAGDMEPERQNQSWNGHLVRLSKRVVS